MDSENNPYRYGSPVSGAHFVGRTKELSAVTARMVDSINLSLISPRRWGKTSLLDVAAMRIRTSRRGAVVSASLLKTPGLGDLAGALVTSIYRVPGGWRRTKDGVADFIRRFRLAPSMSIGADGKPTFTLGPHLSDGEYLRTIDEVYALLNQMTANRPAVMILDEFQEVGSIGDSMAGFFKSLADAYPRVCLAVAGSDRHMMEDLLLTRGSPLFGMTEPIFLEPLPRDVMFEYLVGRAASSRKPMTDDAANEILSLTYPVPNDIQRLAYEAWALADRRIGVGEVDRGMEEAISHQASNYGSVLSRLTANQRKVLIALAQATERAPYSAAFVSRASVANASSVKKVLTVLEATELAVEHGGLWSVDDPFFRTWMLQA
ncbi:MAG: AAA family ATPase [Acidimicrobiales bacterium]